MTPAAPVVTLGLLIAIRTLPVRGKRRRVVTGCLLNTIAAKAVLKPSDPERAQCALCSRVRFGQLVRKLS
jgi:hypothetical protein